MRQLTAADLAVLASPHYAVHVRVLVTDADGVERDLTDLEGIDWFAGAEWGEDIDQPIVQPRIEIRRDVAGTGLSLSPFDESSPLNRRANGSYAPLIDAGRRIRILTATVPPGTEPGPGDWREVFDGEIDEVEWQSDPMLVVCRDPGGVLQDTIIEDPQEYGSEQGVFLHVVMQQLLDDVLGPGVVTLHVPEPPAFMVTRYRPDEGPLLEALQACAGVIGWDVRYVWSETSQAFELTLLRPDREKTTPDHTFGPDDYIDVTRLAVSRADVRNVVEVRYQDSGTHQEERVRVQDDASIARYGRRYMRIVEGEDSPIDTAPEALAMAEAALSDLSEPKAEQEIELRYWWPAELGDLYRFKANGVHYTTDQTLAVVGIRHRLTEGQQRTVLICRGRPSGGYLTWLKRGRRPPESTTVLYAECRARIVDSDETSVTVEVESVPDYGEVWLVDLVGVVRLSGPGLGEPAPSGTQWVFERPAFQAGAGEVVFRAAAPGHESDEDHVVIPEQGRDTVALVMRASVQQVTPTQITVRVAVADPQPGAGDVTITYVATGGSGLAVSPASPQTIPAASVTSDLATTGYVDFTITRPAPGAGAGRVTFTATRSGRVPDVDAVDVPELPPTAGQLPPRALIRILEYTDLFDAVVQITGVAGEPTASPPTQYRWREYREGSTPGSYSDWLPLDSNRQATVTVARRPKGFVIVEAQVRTAAGLESNPVTVRVAPTDGWQDDETGGPKWSFIIDDDGGQMALVNEARSKGQNLLPASAWPEVTFLGVFDKWFNATGIGDDPIGIPLDDMGIGPGDTVVLSGRVKSSAGGRVALQTQFYNSAGAVVGSILTADVTATAYTLVSATGTVPSNAVTCATRVINRDFATNTAFSKQVTLNRGAVPLIEPPPFRPNRETLADVSGPLREGTGMLEGQVIHQLFRHGEIIMVSGSPSGERDVPFGQAYEDAPAVSLAGFRCITFKDDPTFPGDQRLMIHAEVDEDSVKSVAKLISVSGTVTRQSNNFPLGNSLIALGGATEVTLTPAGAIGGIYVVHYSVSVTAFPITEAPRNSINVKVAIETWHGSAWIERAVYTYSAATAGPQQTNTWPHEEKQIIASDLAAGHKIRLVIKDVTTQGDGGSFTVHGFDGVGDPADGVTYETAATAERAISAIPSASDYVKWLVQAIS